MTRARPRRSRLYGRRREHPSHVPTPLVLVPKRPPHTFVAGVSPGVRFARRFLAGVFAEQSSREAEFNIPVRQTFALWQVS